MRGWVKIKGILRKPVMAWIVILLFVFFIWGSSTDATEITSPRSGRPYKGIDRKTEIDRILWMLEGRLEVQKLPEKAKDKLSTLNNEQIRLIDSLSVRMAHKAHTIAADIAFLLVTALIVLS